MLPAEITVFLSTLFNFKLAVEKLSHIVNMLLLSGSKWSQSRCCNLHCCEES